MDEKRSILTDKYFILAILFIVVSLTGAILGIKYLLDRSDEDLITRQQCKTEPPETIDTSFLNDYSGDYPWWNDEYANFKQITLKNKNLTTSLPKNCWITIQFNHSLYVDDKKSKADGGDLRLVYFENENYTEIPIKISNPNTSKTRFSFLPYTELTANSSNENYFLYYGNAAAELNTLSSQEEEILYAQNYKISINRESHPKISGKTSRQWIIRGTETDPDYTKLIYTVEIDESILPDTTPQYEIIDTSIKGYLQKVYKGEYEAKIDLDSLQPGNYQLQTTVISNEIIYKSIINNVFISYPLYVTWTMDWEGTNTENDELDRITEFSQNHNLPITHFFNPRIYVTSEVTEKQAEYLTQWIQGRQINGDEIGMHLHMHYDMVSAAGVEIRKSPKWTNYLNNGHDVPCTAYTYEEFNQILFWAKQEFLTQGLGIPVSFRAGGWFVDLKVLKALEDNGFIIDSSGRDYYVWGTNRITGYWNLQSTTYPYRPSYSNQNASSPSPNFTIWEFPNNGKDSWFYKSEDLIGQFNDNYKNTYLQQAQVVTYLSHPHQIHIDLEVLNPTFDYIDQYLASEDQGPVIYVTLIGAYTDMIF